MGICSGKIEGVCEVMNCSNKEETILQNKIRVALSEFGIVIRNNVGTFKTDDGRFIKCGVPGMSDLLFIGQGFVAWLEVKTATGHASEDQLNFIEQMKAMEIGRAHV